MFTLSLSSLEDWPIFRHKYGHEQRLQIADKLSLCGDGGVYLLESIRGIELKFFYLPPVFIFVWDKFGNGAPGPEPLWCYPF